MRKGDLRVWWIPQIGAPIPTFYWTVNNINEGKLLLDCLAQYDLFQLRNRIKPDYSNAGGLQVCEMDEETKKLDWFDWMDEAGFDIDQHFENLKNDK